ncbi:MAG: HDOD domain-containing protein [Gammaproteobacteria bacterium]|nr:HDOD domain-containing protein [Gammaproteobacteria bacterium]
MVNPIVRRAPARDKSVVSLQELKQFSYLGRLAPRALEEIRGKAHVGELPPGKVLFSPAVGVRWVYFLLEGTVVVEDEGGRQRFVVAGDESGRQELKHRGHGFIRGVTKTKVRFVRVDSDLLEVLGNPETSSGLSVDEIREDDDSLMNRLYYQIYQDYIEDKLEIPNLPEISNRVRKAVEDERNGSREIARILQADPALVARILHVANSALYRGGGSPVGNIRDGIVRLGLTVSRDLVTAFSLQNLFSSKSPNLKGRILELWRHSSMVAAVSYTLARLTHRFDPEQALLAGLVHDMGVAVLLHRISICPEPVTDKNAIKAVIERLRGEVGVMVLSKWGFPDEMITVAREVENWERDEGSTADLCDIVLIAHLHLLTGSGTPPLESIPQIDSIPAYQKLSLGELTPQQNVRILGDAKDEIMEMRRLLLG